MSFDLVVPDFGLVLPQLVVFITAIVLMLGDAFLPKRLHYTWLTAISLIGYTLGLLLLFNQHGKNESTFYGLFRADGLTVFLTLIILSAAILTVLISASYVENLEGRMPLGEYYALLGFAVLGALLTASAGDLVMLFVGIELSSLATYILTAFARRRETSLEGALKYFLLGLFASAILLYGMAWIYGSTGTTDLDQISHSLQAFVAGQDHIDASLLLGLILIVVGLGFKVAAVPFHFWTPDAYDGAPTPVTAYMSVIPKAAAFVAAIRLLVQGLAPIRDDWAVLIAILAFVTMVFGNVVAISQRNVKRMLAYSSIAHTGYILAGLAAYQLTDGFSAGGAADASISSVLYYLLAYTFMNIGAFAIVGWVQHRGSGMMLEDFNGLASRHPLPAAAMAVFLVSLMGIPPLIGFYAKYYVIVALIDAGLLWLAIAIVIMSAISAFFYLRVVAAMYFNEAKVTEGEEQRDRVRTPLLDSGIALMVAATILLGLFSGPIVDLADQWSTALTLTAVIHP
ncbi:MAG TPA: NADH-quinone oxidoreductase subunit N [Thermomicrobiales bacterium]|nr:NADH-quinone oxidoreductase subunit N [Thermomicrobiales bacterium]